MEIDKEYLEGKFNNIDAQFAKLATKDELKIQNKELKDYVRESFQAQQVYVDARFNELARKMKIKERLDQHEYWIDKIAKKTGVKLGQAN